MQPEHATKKKKNYGLWLPDCTILLLQSWKYIFKNWVWICLDSIFDRFCWDFRWFHKHRCWPWTLQFYFWNILDAGLEPSWFYFWNLLILFLQTPQLDDWWYWWFSLCATCGVELPWFHFCILGVSSLGAIDFILFFRGSTPSGCTTRGCSCFFHRIIDIGGLISQITLICSMYGICNMYQHLHQKLSSFVGKSTSTMCFLFFFSAWSLPMVGTCRGDVGLRQSHGG